MGQGEIEQHHDRRGAGDQPGCACSTLGYREIHQDRDPGVGLADRVHRQHRSDTHRQGSVAVGPTMKDRGPSKQGNAEGHVARHDPVDTVKSGKDDGSQEQERQAGGTPSPDRVKEIGGREDQ